jgi:hypothetical protein
VAPTRTARNDLAAQLTEAAFHCRKGRPPPLGERHDLVPLREVSKISYAGIGPKGALNTGDGHGTGAVPITPFCGRRGHHIPRDQALRISLSLQPLEDLLPAAAPLPALKQVMDPGSA